MASKAEAVYNTTSFGPQDNDLFGDYEVASVVDLQLGGSATPATAFEATGYELENGLPTRPQTRVVNKGECSWSTPMTSRPEASTRSSTSARSGPPGSPGRT